MKQLLLVLFLISAGFFNLVSAQTVYATRTGSKYHTQTCRYAQNGYPTTAEEIKSRGLIPCSVCHPPNILSNSTIENDSQVNTADQSTETKVYITKTGSKYHKSTCRYASAGWEVTLQEAKTRGLTPCSVCHPPDH